MIIKRMIINKRIYLMLTLLLMLVLLMTACAPGSGEAGSGKHGEAAGDAADGGATDSGMTGGGSSGGGITGGGDSNSGAAGGAAGGGTTGGSSTAQTQTPGSSTPGGSGGTGGSGGIPGDDSWRIRIIGGNGEEVRSFTELELVATLADMPALPSGIPGQFAHVYSTVNNWPTTRFYAAEGYSVASILMAAGLYDAAQTVSFRADDGYSVSLTREQIFAAQRYFPHVNENEDGAEPVYPIIAWRWREGSDDLGAVRDENPCLIFGQRNPFEHTNPAFVENVSEIIVSTAPCEKWPPALTFPAPGLIASGETVKLQHPDYGLVKMHYTLDGGDPTMLSPMYNPSTYQPELNVPIPITEPTVIKAIVFGYGKADSDIAVFEFTPQG